MSNVSDKEVEKALRRYLEADENSRKIRDKYFRIEWANPNKPIILGQTLTKLALKELDEADAKVIEERKKWENLINF